MPFANKCNVCEATFSHMDAAWKHYTDVHIKKHYICSRCPKEYSELVSFNAHWLNAHKDVPNMHYFTRNIEMSDSSKRILPQLFTETIIPTADTATAGPRAGPSNRAYVASAGPSNRAYVAPGGPSNQNSNARYETTNTVTLDDLNKIIEGIICPAAKTKKQTGENPKTVYEKEYFDEEFEYFLEYYKYMKTAIFECRVCKKRLGSRQSLITHVMTLHGTKRLPNVLRIQSNSMQRKITAKAKTNSCVICSNDFASWQQVKVHFSQQHGIDLLKCKNFTCREVFLFETNLNSHLTKCGTISDSDPLDYFFY